MGYSVKVAHKTLTLVDLEHYQVSLPELRRDMEEWRYVVGYEDRFKVSNTGLLYSIKSNRILSQHTNNQGYKIHATKIGGRRGKAVALRLHRLVAEAFVENPNNKPYVNHKDGNKANNNAENLEWVTSSENIKHAIDTGLLKIKRGLDSPFSKLSSQEDLDFIRSNCRKNGGKLSTRELGRMFSMNHQAIIDIINYKTYKAPVVE